MKYAILFSVFAIVLAAPAFGEGTYILLDEDWEGDGYWPASSPPAPWTVFYNSPADGNDWHGATGYAPSGYAATLGWSPTEAPQVGDLLYTVVDLSAIVLVPSEGDLLYLEWDQILDWFPGSYSGYASVRCLTDGYNTLEYFTWDGLTHTGSYYVDLAAYAGATYFALSFNEYLTSSFGIDGWGVDNIVITHEDYDPVSIKSASLGEIKALYRDH